MLKIPSLAHPNFLDRVALKIYPRYLYPQQPCESVAEINVGILHKLPDIKPYWKIMDFIYLKKGSVLKYLGLAANLNIEGDVQPSYTILETVNPVIDEQKSLDRHLSAGDLVCLTPFDRQFLTSRLSVPLV